MKLKDDVIKMWEDGLTIYDIAEAYNSTPEAVMQLLGIVENPF
jgi:uncharacterized protein (DUF433 family)|tara:strand:- start:2043 stop:2171 length:129 start_codon:yes stop_codon:yes gene_type:complete